MLPASAWMAEWFFREMLTWETRFPALLFAQEYLGRLLGWNMEREAIKLMARCLHEDTSWKPKQEDRDAAHELLRSHGREDLIRAMAE